MQLRTYRGYILLRPEQRRSYAYWFNLYRSYIDAQWGTLGVECTIALAVLTTTQFFPEEDDIPARVYTFDDTLGIWRANI